MVSSWAGTSFLPEYIHGITSLLHGFMHVIKPFRLLCFQTRFRRKAFCAEIFLQIISPPLQGIAVFRFFLQGKSSF